MSRIEANPPPDLHQLYRQMLEASSGLDHLLDQIEGSLQDIPPELSWLPLGVLAVVREKLLAVAEAESAFFDVARPHLERVSPQTHAGGHHG